MIYDLISMFGLHLFYIEVPSLEFLLRKVYHAISYKDAAGKLCLLALESIKPAFTVEEFNKATQ